MFLYCIIGQMDSFASFASSELLGCSSHITLLVHVKTQVPSDLDAQHIASYVELSLLVEKRIYILLQ
jgi:hypothetical protein